MLSVPFELEFKKRPGTSKTFVEKEPFWLNPEAFRAARVLLKEVSSCYHQEDLGVMNWGHAFVYHPSQINFTRALQERFAPIQHSGRWVHISALVEHLYSVNKRSLIISHSILRVLLEWCQRLIGRPCSSWHPLWIQTYRSHAINMVSCGSGQQCVT